MALSLWSKAIYISFYVSNEGQKMQNPYKVGDSPILQFWLEAKAWDEDWEARKWQDFDLIIAMNKARLDCIEMLKDAGIWYDKVIAGKVNDGT